MRVSEVAVAEGFTGVVDQLRASEDELRDVNLAREHLITKIRTDRPSLQVLALTYDAGP